jgi:hypothetical protein
MKKFIWLAAAEVNRRTDSRFHKRGYRINTFRAATQMRLACVAQASGLSFPASRRKPCERTIHQRLIDLPTTTRHEEIRRDAEFDPRDAGATQN